MYDWNGFACVYNKEHYREFVICFNFWESRKNTLRQWQKIVGLIHYCRFNIKSSDNHWISVAINHISIWFNFAIEPKLYEIPRHQSNLSCSTVMWLLLSTVRSWVGISSIIIKFRINNIFRRRIDMWKLKFSDWVCSMCERLYSQGNKRSHLSYIRINRSCIHTGIR